MSEDPLEEVTGGHARLVETEEQAKSRAESALRSIGLVLEECRCQIVPQARIVQTQDPSQFITNLSWAVVPLP